MSDLYKELDYAVQSDLYASGRFIKMYNALENENKQLKELCNKYEEEHKTTFETWLKGQKILTELEEWLKERQDYAYEYENVLDKIQELKEKYK